MSDPTFRARLGVTMPSLAQAMMATLAQALIDDLGGPVIAKAGVVERHHPAYEHIRARAPLSPVWAILEAEPEAVLVVAYAPEP